MSPHTDLAAMYRRRRRQLAATISEGIAIIQSSGRAPDRLLFDKNLRYLTGLDSRKAVLVIAPQGIAIDRWETLHGPEVGRGREVQEVLFVEQRAEREVLLDGAGESSTDIEKASGIADVRPLSAMNEVLNRALMKASIVWLNTPANPGMEGPLPHEYLRARELRERYYWLELRNIAPLIHEMRWVKDDWEVENLRRAFEIHSEIYVQLMQALKPGANEALGQAIFD